MENKCKCTDNPKYSKKGSAWSLEDRSGTKVCWRCGTVSSSKTFQYEGCASHNDSILQGEGQFDRYK